MILRYPGGVQLLMAKAMNSQRTREASDKPHDADPAWTVAEGSQSSHVAEKTSARCWSYCCYQDCCHAVEL
ncbi:hypothetical protein V1264_013201 [Littorina saxatilis]|uniref:Uncharacterized protein n=1 Tax=Littorina saxatilis TaxID=31220 RepID=A0AAN9GIA1_9CAEN